MREKYIFMIAGVVAIVIGVLMALSGAGTSTSPVVTSYDHTAAMATVVPFTEIVQGKKSNVSTRSNFIIISPDQLKDLWKLIDATSTPPRVDFATHSIIAVFAGKEPSVSIAVAKIEDTDERTVSVAIAKPEGSCTKKVLTTSPYEIILVPTTSLSLTHKDIPMPVTCSN